MPPASIFYSGFSPPPSFPARLRVVVNVLIISSFYPFACLSDHDACSSVHVLVGFDVLGS